MKRVSKFLSIVLVLLMLTSLSTTTYAAEKPTFDKLDLSLFTGGFTTLWDEMITLFKKYYPDVEVTADLSNDNAIRVRARLLAGDPPDVITTSGPDFDPWEAAASGLLMPLDDFFANGMAADGRKLSDVINPSLLNDGKVNDALYLPTVMTSYGGWWYNAALFREKNWQVPTSWEEFLELAPKIKEAGIAPFIHQGSKQINYLIWGYLYEAVAAAGGYEAFEDAFLKLKEGSWKSDAMLQAATWLYQIEEKGFMYEGAAGIEFTQAQIEFVNDKAAMIPCGSWFENEMADVTPKGFEMSFMPLPLADANGIHYLCTFSQPMACPANSKNPEAAKAWLGVLYSKEGQKLMAKYGQTPIVSDLSTDEIAEYITPTWASVIETASRGDIAFVNNLAENWYAKMWPNFQDNVTNLILMEITPEEFCNNMEEVIKTAREDDSIPKYYTKE